MYGPTDVRPPHIPLAQDVDLQQAQLGNFESLSTYYGDIDTARRADGDVMRKTAMGSDLASDIIHIEMVFSRLVTRGVVDLTKPFLDAGCADARIVALASQYWEEAYGIESDETGFRRGKEALRVLSDSQTIKREKVEVIKGDFGKVETYENTGLKFSEIGTFYNYYNNPEQIRDLICELSPPGTVFLLHQFTEPNFEFNGLRYEGKIAVKDDAYTLSGTVWIATKQ